MRRVKTWLRSAMVSDRLSDLCVLHYHQERVRQEMVSRTLATMVGESDDDGLLSVISLIDISIKLESKLMNFDFAFILCAD